MSACKQSGTSIRLATSDDIVQLVQMRLMLQHHMEAANKQILKHNEAWKNNLYKFYADLINDPNCLVLVAIDCVTGQAIGMAVGELNENRFLETERFVKVNDVWVNEDYRRKGITSAMINEIIKFYRDRDIATFTLNYVINNLEAESTWDALGFMPIIKNCVKTID